MFFTRDMDIAIPSSDCDPAGVNCPLPKPPREGRIVHDKAATGTSTIYGQGWSYECNPPKAPSYERGSCMADGTATEPPVCRGKSRLVMYEYRLNCVVLHARFIFFFIFFTYVSELCCLKAAVLCNINFF